MERNNTNIMEAGREIGESSIRRRPRHPPVLALNDSSYRASSLSAAGEVLYGQRRDLQRSVRERQEIWAFIRRILFSKPHP